MLGLAPIDFGLFTREMQAASSGASSPFRRRDRLPSLHRQRRRVRVPCADRRLQRESARTAPIGTRRHAGVIRDSAGNLYGTTELGGAANTGVAYKLDTTGHETVLYSFTGGADGAYPVGVIRDSAGNLYGTTDSGGAANSGVVYKLDTAGHETVLYSFTGGADGAQPFAGVIRDSAGNLYGTTHAGGTANAGATDSFCVSPSHMTRRPP